MKTILISFANSNADPLKSITAEDEGIHNILVSQNRGNYNIHRESYATINNINAAFGMHGNNIAIFHYAGHASQNSLLFNDQDANGVGIAHQLQPSVASGALNLVILNGCSTATQVDLLLNLGVPAVIATNASINDTSAKIFGITFFQNVCQKRMTIRNAFTSALAAAQLATSDTLGLDEQVNRDLHIPGAAPRQPFWGLFYKKAEMVDRNPVPLESSTSKGVEYEPNLQLSQTIFNALIQADNGPAKRLQDRKMQEIISENEVQRTITDVLPHPIAVQLSTLFAGLYVKEKQSAVNRLTQIGRVFHITTEFMGIIMISQLWELKILGEITDLPDPIAQLMEDYFNLSIDARAVYNYSHLIRSIRKYIDTLPKVDYFVTELKDMLEEDPKNKKFGEACEYLSYIREATYQLIADPTKAAMIQESEAPELCLIAEDMLSVFFEKLGFLHRYTLTSVQNIRINKYRHDTLTEFDHQVVRLMNSNANHEVNYYLLAKHLDNSGVVLIRHDKLTVFNVDRRQYKADSLEFLNLSPLVVDVNTFTSRTNRTDLVLYGQYRGTDNVYVFRAVSKPDEALDQFEININQTFKRTEQLEQARYEAICKQLTAFKEFALHEAVTIV